MNAALTAGAGAVVGAAATYLTSRMLVDERDPSKIAPVTTAVSFAAGAGAATYLTKGAPRQLLAGAAIGAVIAGATLSARPKLLWNTRNGLLDGVYQPERLIVIKDKVHVEGKVTRVSYPGDGDIHVVVRPDAAYMQYARGPRHPDTIIAEPVPDDQGHIQVPHVGDRIAVDGPLAWDSTHGWSEVHPVKDLTFLQADGPRPTRTASDLKHIAAEKDQAEQAAERRALIGGGIALAGTGALVAGAFKGAQHAGLVGTAAGNGWGGAVMLLAAGGAAVLGGAVVGGQSKD